MIQLVAMEEVTAAEPWQDDLRPATTEEEARFSSMASDSGDEDEDEAERAEGNQEEGEEEEDEQVEEGELVTDADMESILSGAPSLPEEASRSPGNGNGTGHETPSNVLRESKVGSLKKGHNNGSAKPTAAAAGVAASTNNTLRRSTSSTTARTQAPPSPKPFLRSSSSMAAARRGESFPDGSNNNGSHVSNGSNGKLAPPIISATPIIKRRGLPAESPSIPTVRRSSAGPGTLTGLRTPSRTTDPRRTSLSGMASSVGNPRRNSLSGVTSLSRSMDLSSSSDLRQWGSSNAARTPALKASGRRTSTSASSPGASSPQTTYSTATSSHVKKTSPSVRSSIDSGRPPAKSPTTPAKSYSPASSSLTGSRGNSVSSSPSGASTQKSPVSNGVLNKESAKKKLNSSASLGPRRTSSFAEPVGNAHKLSTSSSFSSPSERSPNVGGTTTRSSPLERLLSSSPTTKLSPSEKAQNLHSKGIGKSSPSDRLHSSGKAGKASPTSSVPSHVERLSNSKQSLSPSSSSNGSGGLKEKSSSPMSGDRNSKQSPGAVAAGPPSMLTRRKSLTSDARDSRFISLPPVDVKAGDDVRLDLRGQKVRTLDGNLVSLTPKMEFVYLRDNKLATLNGIEILRRVKVLDLSFNEFKGAGFEPLATCKALQQLYLAGNQITSLSGLPQLPNLEFLSVAQNKIKSLNMASQPRLQVLAASKNKICTLKDFPHLPALEHLRLEENPILESFHVEAQSILLVGPSLKKFNDRDLSMEEQELARMYPPSTALCIREGWELCDPEEAAESTLQFLISQWSESMPPGYTVEKAWVDQPAEEDPCTCEFVFQKVEGAIEDANLELRYQWFVGDKTPANFVAVEGAEGESYWPKHEDVGNCLKVECSIVLGETEYPPIFAISAPVAPGSKCPKILSLEVDGDAIEGAIVKGSAIVAWCGGAPGKSVSSWLRRADHTSPVAIMGAEEPEYRLTLDDVGSSLIFMFTPMTEEGVKGEPQYAATAIIQAASPSVSAVQIIGDAINGNVIKGNGHYFGGKEGASKFEWLRENPESGEFKVVSRGNLDYTLSDEDVGRRMMFMYTPVNFEGKVGDPVTAVSTPVLLAPPKVENLRVVGDLKDGSKVAVSAIFMGGTEGASRVQWFKKISPTLPTEDSQVEPLSSSKVAKAFRIPLGAVGHYLVAKYIPVRSDGESGEPVFAISETIVEMLPPGLTFLNIVGDFVEGETLTAQYGYVGGYEGVSLYNWYLHDNENDSGTLVPEAEGQLQYRISRQAVNQLVSFRCRPVRDDGLIGEWKSTFGMERTRAGLPKLLSLHIVGEPIEGYELQVGKEYWGGEEGICKVQWFLTRQDGTQREIKGAVQESYTIQGEDIDGLICVSCEPVRSDGVTGPVAVSSSVGPVAPAPPTCNALEICGVPVEGGCLTFKAAYKGGEKGACIHEWVRQNEDGSQDPLSTEEILDLTSEDVGSRIELVYTPVRKDGSVGDSRSTLSDVVVDGEPEGTDLVIPQCFEDVEVVPRKAYFGGKEGEGEYTWYRTAHRPKDGQLPEDARFLSETEVYTPKLDDVGSYLVLHWVPVRDDGKRGTPLVGYSNLPVAPALPVVRNVSVREVSAGMFVGEGEYYGGLEGDSRMCWYRQTTGGLRTLIADAHSKTYVVNDDDYTCSVVFGYTPVRNDGIMGELVLSDPSPLIYPELPRIQKLVISGKPIEGEILTALEVIPKGEVQQRSWEKYKKDIKYQWSRSWQPESTEHFETLPAQRSCTYKVRLEDVGYCLRCEGIISDVFGRSAEPAFIITPPVAPGFPRVENLEIEGRGYHTSLYAVRGIYSGGKEGKSMLQWFRAMAGSPDLIPISGEVGRMYEANVDDVGYRLVAVYTPVREDGVEGGPVSASTDPIIVDPEVSKEVKLKLELGVVKFEALRDRDRSPMKSQNPQGLGSLERRVLDVNRKRVKVVKPGSKTHFASTEIRGTYAPPFHVEVFRNDQHRVKIVMDTENEVDLMVQSRHIRDIIVLVIRGFSQRFNSTPLNLLLKM